MPSPRALMLVQSRVELRRRLGQFAVGTFAGACALFAPRLTLLVGQPQHAAVTLDAFGVAFVIAGAVLSLIVGGVALILEWDGTRSPKDTFMAALGVPALLSGMFSTATMSQETLRQADLVAAQTTQLLDGAGIAVEGAPPDAVVPSQGTWPPLLPLMATAYAATLDSDAGPQKAAATPAAQGGLGIQYRQVRYWVVLHEDRSRAGAERRAAALGTRHGAVSVQALGTTFSVVLGTTTLPYSEAASRAVDVKKQSEGAVTPKLLRAG